MEREIIQFYIVNSDLIKNFKMSGGKVSAQVGHGATISALKLGQDPIFLEWFGENGNKQKKIILRGKEKELQKLIELGAFPVIDNGHTEVPLGSLTVVVFPPMFREDAPKALKRLQIYTGEEHL